MSNRVRNPEIYVKGYGKSITKDDLKSWFRDFGKNCMHSIQGSILIHRKRDIIQEFEDYYDAEQAVKEMNDNKV